MSGPRNRIAYERGQRTRSVIRDMLRRRDPIAKPLTAKVISDSLYIDHGVTLGERAIRLHVQAIREGK